MAAGGSAPPAEAMRGAKGVSAIIVVVIAIITFVAGLGLGYYVLAPAPPKALTTLVLGTNTPFPPFEFYNSTTHQLQGFDIELIQTILTRAGYAYEWRDFRDFQVLLSAVSAQGIDIGIGAITENGATGTQRNLTLAFSDPYFVSNQGVLKRTSDARTFCANRANCTATELNRTDLKIAVQAITTSEFWVEDNLPAVVNANHLSIFPDVSQVLQALSSSSVDIVVIDKPAADGIAAGNAVFAVEGTILTNELYGFAVAHGDPLALLPKINSQLAGMRADGTYTRILNKWF